MTTLKINCVRSHRRAGWYFVKGEEKIITLEDEDYEDYKDPLEMLRRDPELHVQVVEEGTEPDDNKNVEPPKDNGKSAAKAKTTKRTGRKQPAPKTAAKDPATKVDDQTDPDATSGDDEDTDPDTKTNEGDDTKDGDKTE